MKLSVFRTFGDTDFSLSSAAESLAERSQQGLVLLRHPRLCRPAYRDQLAQVDRNPLPGARISHHQARSAKAPAPSAGAKAPPERGHKPGA
jgi:hypothetical protein